MKLSQLYLTSTEKPLNGRVPRIPTGEGLHQGHIGKVIVGKAAVKVIVSIASLTLLCGYLISSGQWQGAIVKPIAGALGQDVADQVDQKTRDGLASGDHLLEKAKQQSLPDLLNQLKDIPNPSNQRLPKYERDQFGDGWQSNLDGCATREIVLKRDLSKVTMRQDRKCKVETGKLKDPYTARSIDFDSVRDPLTVQIDHIVPLSVAWRMGAAGWSSNQRVEFSNDTANLIAVDGPTNNKKGDKTPSRWLPSNKSYVCTYASKYTEVSNKYGLSMEQADAETLQNVLEQC